MSLSIKLGLRSFVAVVVGSSLVVACSAAPEDTGSSDQDLAIGSTFGGGAGTHLGPEGTAPVFPPVPATYCPQQWSGCSLQNPWTGYSDSSNVAAQAELAQLTALGCDPGMYYRVVGMDGRIAVCWDTPQARAAFHGYVRNEFMCSACLPMLPAGQIYIDINLAFHGDCESTCASTTGGKVVKTGTTTVKGK